MRKINTKEDYRAIWITMSVKVSKDKQNIYHKDLLFLARIMRMTILTLHHHFTQINKQVKMIFYMNIILHHNALKYHHFHKVNPQIK